MELEDNWMRLGEMKEAKAAPVNSSLEVADRACA